MRLRKLDISAVKEEATGIFGVPVHLGNPTRHGCGDDDARDLRTSAKFQLDLFAEVAAANDSNQVTRFL